MKRRIYACCLIAGVSLSLTGAGKAAIITFIGVNIPIATTASGTSVNLETGASADTNNLAGADVNFFFGGTGIANDADTAASVPTFQPIRVGTGNTDTVSNRSVGSVVDGSNIYNDPADYGGSSDHIGTQFTAGTPGYIGFSLQTGSGLVYGWMDVTLNPNTSTGTIHSWAYEDSGSSILVGAVPEPSAALLGFFGLCAALVRRRRK